MPDTRLREFLRTQLDDLKAKGLYKAERRIETPQRAGIGVGIIFGNYLTGALRNPSAALMAGVEMSCGAILPKHLWEGAAVVGAALASNRKL